MMYFNWPKMIGSALLFLFLGGLVALIYAAGYQHGAEKTRSEWHQDSLARFEANKAAMQKSQDRERQLQSKLNRLEEEKNHEITRLNANVDHLLGKLRERQTRPATAPGTLPAITPSSESPKGCTGAELYREDGEFLVREAARADTLRLFLAQCEAAYDSAQQVTP